MNPDTVFSAVRSAFEAVKHVDDPYKLLAFALVVAGGAFAWRWKMYRDLVSAASDANKTEVAVRALERLHLDTSKLAGDQQLTLALRTLRDRNQRFLVGSGLTFAFAIGVLIVGVPGVGADTPPKQKPAPTGGDSSGIATVVRQPSRPPMPKTRVAVATPGLDSLVAALSRDTTITVVADDVQRTVRLRHSGELRPNTGGHYHYPGGVIEIVVNGSICATTDLVIAATPRFGNPLAAVQNEVSASIRKLARDSLKVLLLELMPCLREKDG